MLLFTIYYLISPILFILLLIISLFNKKIRILLQKQKKSVQKIKSKLNTDKKKIIIHAASAGEYEQIKPLLKTIDKNLYFTIITCMSPTIYKSINEDKLSDACCYHPFDFPWNPKKFFKITSPSIYLTTRHDIWPMHLYAAKKMKIRTMIINANLYKKSNRLKWYIINFTKYIFNLFDLIMVPSKRIQHIFNETLQINNTHIVSDTRFEQIMNRKKESNGIPQIESIYKQNNVIFGSVSYEDLKLFDTPMHRDGHVGTTIIIVPHEIDSNLIEKIEKKIEDNPMPDWQRGPVVRFSHLEENPFVTDDFERRISFLIVDKVGILPELYKYTKIAYVGGGFGKGVHSTTEPLIYNNIVCYGPNIDLLDEAKEMHEKGCGFIINSGQEFWNIANTQFSDRPHFSEEQKIKEEGNIKLKIKKNTEQYINEKGNSAEKIYEIIKKYA